MHVYSLARKLDVCFESAKRSDGTKFIRRKKGCPYEERLQELIYAAHNGMFPDDWKYEIIAESITNLAFADKDEDTINLKPEVDVYTSKLLAWVSSNMRRLKYVDDVLATGKVYTLAQSLMDAQRNEIDEIFSIVVNELCAWADEIDE